jgi:type VI protein secretion system component VasF
VTVRRRPTLPPVDPPPLRVVTDGREARRRPAHARIPWPVFLAGIVAVIVGLWTIAAVSVVTVIIVLLAAFR